ncbi:hypothetical protein [Denitromonas sp.]|uniref:hypothetical protein n=1 Tax=Denitromonas sp. TaxID=2734609 RepID=UPI001DABD101|nr:hypothetical protein [Rhodocyclaceae bacterium]
MNAITYMQKITEVAQENSQAAKSILEISLQAVRDLGALNEDFVHSVVSEAKIPLSAEELKTQSRLHAERFEKGSDYVRSIGDVFMKTQAEISKLEIQRMETLARNMSAQFQQLIPAQNHDATRLTEMLKEHFDNASSAYESMFSMWRDALNVGVNTVTPSTNTGHSSKPARQSVARQNAA